MNQDCNADCQCDYVKYNPVCSTDSQQKFFVSACHAGCAQFEFVDEVKVSKKSDSFITHNYHLFMSYHIIREICARLSNHH